MTGKSQWWQAVLYSTLPLSLFLPQCWQRGAKSERDMFYINTISSTQRRKCCFLDSDSTSAWCSRSHVIDKTWVKIQLTSSQRTSWNSGHSIDMVCCQAGRLVHPTSQCIDGTWNPSQFTWRMDDSQTISLSKPRRRASEDALCTRRLCRDLGWDGLMGFP